MVTDELRPGHWGEYCDILGAGDVEYLRMRDRATVVKQWEPDLIPGALQTPGYTRELMTMKYSRPAERFVQFRAELQSAMFSRPDLPRSFIVGEVALRLPSRGVVLEQLRQLHDRAGDADIRILPFGAGLHPGLTGPFTYFEVGGEPCVYLEASGRNGDRSRVLRGRAAGGYLADFEQLTRLSVPVGEFEL
jgi:hypothetical protein